MRIVLAGTVRITKSTIEAAWKRRQRGTRLVLRDAVCPGLRLTVNPVSMTWCLDWRPRGVDPATGRRWPMQSVTLGNPQSHSPDEARDAAGRLKGQAKAGADIGAERRAKLAAVARRRATTVGRTVDEYVKILPGRPKLRGVGSLGETGAKAEAAHVRRSFAAMGVGETPIEAVAAQDIGKILTAEANRPATARKHFGAVSRFFAWAIDQGYAASNPCLALPKARRPRPVAPRPHYPTVPELAKLWAATPILHESERDFLRWLIVIPSRLREASRMRWEHVDLVGARWSLPGSMTKTREPHSFHLPTLAATLLRGRHAAAGEPTEGLVFPAPRSGKEIQTTTAIKRRLSEKSGVTGWTPHDFRRSFASTCAEHGVAESVADAVLSHRQSTTRSGVLAVYQRAARKPEQTAALETWAAVLDAAGIRLADENAPDPTVGRM